MDMQVPVEDIDASCSVAILIDDLPLSLTASELLYIFQSTVSSDQECVVSAQIMREQWGESKGFGFLHIRGPGEEISKEISKEIMIKMNGLMIEGKRVTMRLHKPHSVSAPAPIDQQPRPLKAMVGSSSPPSQALTLSKTPDYGLCTSNQPSLSPPACIPSPAITSLPQLFSLSISQIWFFLIHPSSAASVRSFGIPETDVFVKECTEDWVAGFLGEGKGGIEKMRQLVEGKVGDIMKAWGFKSFQRKIAFTALQSEDPSSLILLLNCHPVILKDVIQHRIFTIGSGRGKEI